MSLVGYGLRRSLPLWAGPVALTAGLFLVTDSGTEAARVLGLAGLFDADGVHRAHSFALLALAGVALASWSSARLGSDLVGRDRAWIAPRPAARVGTAASVFLGLLLAVSLCAAQLALAAEWHAEGVPAEQQLGAPGGPAVLRFAAAPETARRVTWRFPEGAGSALPSGARLNVTLRPLAGEGRSAEVRVRVLGPSPTEPQRFTIGAARRVSVELPKGAIGLELEHGGTGPPLALFAAEARFTRPRSSSRLASLVLATRAWILIVAAAGLALGLGTRLAPGLAALFSLTLVLVSSATSLGDPLGCAAWFEALAATEEGWVAAWPQAGAVLAMLLLVAVGFGLLASRLAPRAGWTRADVGEVTP